jgi:hypothetical protein
MIALIDNVDCQKFQNGAHPLRIKTSDEHTPSAIPAIDGGMGETITQGAISFF